MSSVRDTIPLFHVVGSTFTGPVVISGQSNTARRHIVTTINGRTRAASNLNQARSFASCSTHCSAATHSICCVTKYEHKSAPGMSLTAYFSNPTLPL